MPYADGGADSNLVIGYSPIEDIDIPYGFAVQLCQTFTIDIETVFHLFVPKFEVDTIPDLQHFILYNTDGAGKPTGSPIADITKQFTQSEFRDPPKWRRILFPDFPVLAPGLYAMVLTVPLPHTLNKPKWAARQTPDLYPDGKAWKSSNFGLTWSEIPDTSFLFEVWGWTPPPDPPPTPVISNWAPMGLTMEDQIGAMELIISTDIPVHLFMRWTNVQPVTHAQELIRRGISLPNATRYCFVAWEENEQEEAGDTYVHTFIKPDWAICETRWFYFIGTKQAEESPSASPIFYLHRKGVEMYVISLGKLTESEILHGHVKLKEGAGITITRDDPNNALEIIAAAAEYEGFGDKWLKYDPSGQLAASLHWRFDEVSFGVTGVGIDCRLYTEPMRAWGFRRPVACELRRARGADGAGNPYVYSAIVATTPDIRNNMSQPCVGFMTDPIGAVSCFNGDGVGFKKTDFAWGIEPVVWLKWVISDVDIKFYGNNTLLATHTTYRPTNVRDLFFAHQAYGTSPYPRMVYLTRPHYSAD
ncbi:hypothetical protein ES703_41274 [subsurface metagenome]